MKMMGIWATKERSEKSSNEKGAPHDQALKFVSANIITPIKPAGPYRIRYCIDISGEYILPAQ